MSFLSALQFVAEEFILRTRATHANHCAALEGPLYDHTSTTYGLTRDSVLNSLRYFHVTEGLPPDVMHDILEGTLILGLKCLLFVLIHKQKLFTLELLNSRIEDYPFGNDISDPPKALPSGFPSLFSDSPKKLGGLCLNLNFETFDNYILTH